MRDELLTLTLERLKKLLSFLLANAGGSVIGEMPELARQQLKLYLSRCMLLCGA